MPKGRFWWQIKQTTNGIWDGSNFYNRIVYKIWEAELKNDKNN